MIKKINYFVTIVKLMQTSLNKSILELAFLLNLPT